jgi:hypothetical protein
MIFVAVIVEKGFFVDVEDYKKMLTEISEVITEIVKKEMQISGIMLNIFGDTNVNLGQGM